MRPYSVVVDGQQRLTTVILLLDAIRREMAPMESLANLAKGIYKNYIAARDQAGQPIYRLTLNRDCKDYFIQNVLSDIPGPEGARSQSHQRLDGAKKFFACYLEAA